MSNNMEHDTAQAKVLLVIESIELGVMDNKEPLFSSGDDRTGRAGHVG